MPQGNETVWRSTITKNDKTLYICKSSKKGNPVGPREVVHCVVLSQQEIDIAQYLEYCRIPYVFISHDS